MSRLSSEFHRLYLAAPGSAPVSAPGTDLSKAPVLDAQGRLRMAVLGLADPSEWAPLAAIWQALQSDWGLPAPAISVDGRQGLLLWFSWAEPQPVERIRAFLSGLCRRHLAELPAHRIVCLPEVQPQGPIGLDQPARWQALLPAREQDSERWSAFVAQDLAPLFADTPWLDVPPGEDAQASLLAPLGSITQRQFEQVLAGLMPPAPAPASLPESLCVPAPQAAAAPPACAAPALSSPGIDPSGPASPMPWQGQALAFLQAVVADTTAPLAQRIEAARVLLQHDPRR